MRLVVNLQSSATIVDLRGNIEIGLVTVWLIYRQVHCNIVGYKSF